MRVLFVCTGNICRSPAAEAIARHFITTGGLNGRVVVDSAGTEGYHAGEAPDPRMRKAALQRGYDLAELRARKLEAADFGRFDCLVAMDAGHLRRMRQLCPPVYQDRLTMLMDFVPGRTGEEVPDPYYGGPRGFELVLDLCEQGVQALLVHLSAQAGGEPGRA